MLTIPTDQPLAVGHGLAAQTTLKTIPSIVLLCSEENSLKTYLQPSLHRIQSFTNLLPRTCDTWVRGYPKESLVCHPFVSYYTFSRRRPAPHRTRWSQPVLAAGNSMHVARARISGNRPCCFDPYPCQELAPAGLVRTSPTAPHCVCPCTYGGHMYNTPVTTQNISSSVGGPYIFVGGKSRCPHRLRLRHYHPSGHRSHCNHCHRHGQYNSEYNYRYRRR